MVFRFKNGVWTLSRRTRVMGILNVTPNSFSDGGKYTEPTAAVKHAEEMIRNGADMIDIGAQSTRPGHVPVTADEEWARLEPVLSGLCGRISIPLSVDTYYPEVAEKAVAAGVSVINDVSGSLDGTMAALAAKTGAGLVMMHSGNGSDDTGNGNAVENVLRFFQNAVDTAEKAGLPTEYLCLDPGIGFGKTRQEDLLIAASMRELCKAFPGTAILVGASRKRVIGECLDKNVPPHKRVHGSAAFHTIAQYNGARILRVHDVAEAVQAVRVTDAILAAASNK